MCGVIWTLERSTLKHTTRIHGDDQLSIDDRGQREFSTANSIKRRRRTERKLNETTAGNIDSTVSDVLQQERQVYLSYDYKNSTFSSPTVSPTIKDENGRVSTNVPTSLALPGSPTKDTPTKKHTSAPTGYICTIRGEEIIRKRISKLYSSVERRLETSIAQTRALEWIVGDMKENCVDPNLIQRYSLAVVYYALGGENWNSNELWLSQSTECDWFGVTCNSNPTPKVIEINLQQNNLVGRIPDELAQLTSLQGIVLYENNLSGSIPPSIGVLERLINLDLEHNALNGTLPDELCNLICLEVLHLSFNQLEGQISETLLPTSLREIWLTNNRFTGPIPCSIASLNKLNTLLLQDNRFEGEIPWSLGQLANLRNLCLSRNKFHGKITFLMNLKSLEVLLLEQNEFTGTIPSSIMQLSSLKSIGANKNLLSGSLPDSLFTIDSIETITFSDNQLTGTLSSNIGNLPCLQTLDLSGNEIRGTLPESLFNIPSLRGLFLSQNRFGGSLPLSNGNSSPLRYLLLDNNRFRGMIPELSAGQWKDLEVLRLQNNVFGGTMPESVCSLRSKSLVSLAADCLKPFPEIECNVPECCTDCF